MDPGRSEAAAPDHLGAPIYTNSRSIAQAAAYYHYTLILSYYDFVMLQYWSSEEIRSFNERPGCLTTEQDHGRTDAPGRKVRTNVEDTREVVVAARLTFLKIDQLCFTEFGTSSQDSMKWGSEASLGGGGDATTLTREGLDLPRGLPPRLYLDCLSPYRNYDRAPSD